MSQSQSTHPEFPAPQGPSNLVTRRSEQPISSSTNPPNQSSEEENSTTRFNRSTLSDSEQANISNRSSLGNLADPRFNDNSDHHQSEAPVLNEILTDQKPFDTNSYNNPHYQQQLSHHSPSHHSIPKQSHSFNSQGTFDTNDLLNAQNHPSQTYPNPSDPIKSSNYQYPRLDQFNSNRYDLVHDKLSDYYHHSDTPSDPKPDVPKAHFELNRDLLDQSLVEDSNDQVLSTPHAGRGSSDHQDSPVPITVQVENPQQHLDQLFETSSTSSIDASHLSLPGNSPGQVGSEFHHLQGEGSHSGHSLLYDKHSLASTVQTEKQRGGRDQLSEGNLQVGQTTTQVAEELPRSEKSESTLPSTTEVHDLSKSAQSIHPTTDLQASPQLSFSSQISNSNVSSPESKKTTPLSKDSQFENQSRSPPLFESNPVGDSRAISNNPQETSSTHTRFYHFPPYSSPLNGQASPDVTDCKPEEDLSEEDSFQEGAKYEQNDYHLSDPSAAQEKPKRKFYFNPELANQTTVATGITSSSQDGWGTGETHQFDSVSTATEQTPLDGQALERKANENTLSNELDEHTQIVSEPSSSVDISMRSSVSTTNQAHQQQIDTTEQRSLPNSQHSIILHSSLPATHQLEKSSNLSQVEEPRNNTIANFNKPASYKDNEKRPDSPMTVQSETSQSFNPSQVAPEEPQLPKITKPLGREPPTSPNVLATDKKEDPSDVSRFGGSTFTLSSRPYLKSPFKSQSNLTERAVESDAMNSPQSDYINDHEQQAAQTSHDQPADYYEDDLLNQENFEMESVLDEEDFIPPADQSYALEMEDSQSSFSDEDPDCSYTGDVPTTQLSTITELSESVPEAHLSRSLLRSPLRQDWSSPLSSTIQHTSHLDNGPLSHSETSLVEPQDLIGTSSIPENAFTPDLDQGIPSQSDDLSRSQERSLQPHTKESPIPEGDVSSEGPNNVEQADSLGSAQLENTSAMEERGFTAVHSDVQSVDPSSTARASEDQAVQSTILQPDPVSARSEFQAEAELINNGVIDNPSSVPPPSPPGPIVANEPVPIETDRLGDSVMEHGINLPVEPAVTSDQLASGAQEHVPEKLTASTFQSPSQLHNAQVASTDATEEMVDTVSNSAEDDKSSSAEHQSTCSPQLHSLEILHQDTGPMVDSSVKDESPRSSIVTTHLVKNPRNLNQTEDLDKDDHLLQDTHLEETQSTVDSPTEDRSVQSVIVIDSPTEDPPTPYQSNDPAESSTATKLQLSPEVLDLQDEDCHPYKNPPLQVPIEDNPSQSINVEDDPMATAPTDDLDEKGDNSFVMTETSDSYSQLAHRDAVEDSPGHAVSNLEQTMEPELLSPQAESFEAQTEFPTTIKAVVLETSDSYSDTSRETTLLENPAPVPSACHMDPPNLVPVGHGLAEDSEMSFGDGPPSSTDSTHAPAAQSSHQEIPLADSAANLVEPVNVRNKEAEPNPTLEATESSTAPVAVSEAMHASEAELSPQDASLPEPSTSLTHEKAGQDQVESPPAMQVVESDVLPVDVTDAIHASDAHSSSAMSLSDSNGLIEIEEARQVHSSQEVSLSGSARSLVESEEVGQQAVESNFTEDITSSDIPQADISEVAQASDVEVSPQDAPLPDSVTSLAQPEKVGQGEVESILMTETTESGIPSVENTDAMQESDAQAVLNPLSALDPSAAQSESQTQAQLPLNDAVKKATTLSSERLCEHSAVEEAGLVETESLSDHVSDHEQRGSINPATLSHSKTGELLSDRVSDHLETAAEQPSSPDPLQMPSQSGDVGTQLSFSDTEDNTVEIRAEPAEEAVLQKEIDVNTAGPSEEPQAVVEVSDPPQDPRPKDEDHGSEHSSSSPIVTKAPHKQRSFVDQAKEVVTEENNKDDRKRPARSELNNDLSDAFAIIDTSDATTYSSRADRYVNPTLGRRLSTSVKDILPKRQNQADLMKKSPLDDVHMAEDFHFDVNTQLANLPKCHSEDEYPKEERDVDLHITLAAPYREIAQQPPQSCHDVFAVVCLDMEADPDAILVPSKFDDAVSNFLRKYFAGAYVDQICVHCTELADSELGPRYTFRGGLGAFAQRCLINASDEEQRSLPSNSIIGTPTASNWNPEGNQKQRPQPTNSDRWTVAGGGRRPSRPTAEENALPFRRIHIVTVTLSGFTTPPRSNEHRFALIRQQATAFTTHPSIWQKQTLNMHSPRGDFVTIYHGCRQSSIKSFCNKGISPQARIPNEFSAEAAFYCTSSLQQAYEHPLHNHPGRDPANNVAVLWFLVPLSVLLGAEAPEAGTAAFKVLQFASPNKEWERFCTKNLYDPDPEYNHEHDIVIGPSCLPGRTRQNVSPLYVHSTNGVPGVQLAFCTRRARKWIGSTVQAAFVEQQSE